MRLNYVWPHLFTPLFYAVTMVQVGAFVAIQNTPLATFVSLVVIALAFAVSTSEYARPFHIERLSVVAALVLSYLAIAESVPTHVLEAIHVHDSTVSEIFHQFYNLLWLVLAAIAFIGFWRNPMRRAPVVWLASASFGFLLALVPLGNSLSTEPSWIVILRFNVSFFIYLFVALGDAAFLTERAYHHAAKDREQYEHRANDIDISLPRTFAWIPLSLCIFFVKPVFLIFFIAAFSGLVYIVLDRVRLASDARESFLSGIVPKIRDTFARPGKRKRGRRLNVDGEYVSLDTLSRSQLAEIVIGREREHAKGMPAIDIAANHSRKKK